MVDKPDDGGAAYPQTQYFSDGSAKVQEGRDRGLSIRDFFAAAALQGICANGLVRPQCSGDMKVADADAYAIADEMLEARQP